MHNTPSTIPIHVALINVVAWYSWHQKHFDEPWTNLWMIYLAFVKPLPLQIGCAILRGFSAWRSQPVSSRAQEHGWHHELARNAQWAIEPALSEPVTEWYTTGTERETRRCRQKP